MTKLKRYEADAIWADIENRGKSISVEFCKSEDVFVLEEELDRQIKTNSFLHKVIRAREKRIEELEK